MLRQDSSSSLGSASTCVPETRCSDRIPSPDPDIKLRRLPSWVSKRSFSFRLKARDPRQSCLKLFKVEEADDSATMPKVPVGSGVLSWKWPKMKWIPREDIAAEYQKDVSFPFTLSM